MKIPPYKACCWITDEVLGLGYSAEEAKLNALSSNGVLLIVQGGEVRTELVVVRDVIRQDTLINVLTYGAKAVTCEGFRTINIALHTQDIKLVEAVALQVVDDLLDLNPIRLMSATALHSLNIWTSPPEVLEVEEAPIGLLKSVWDVSRHA